MVDHTQSSPGRVAQCCCGALSARVTGQPAMVVACSCEECQRRTGAPFGVSTYWTRSAVETSGAATRFTRPGQKGRTVTMHFCPKCGSTVYWTAEFNPDWMGVALGSFADPTFPAPTISGWERSKHDWIVVPAEQHHDMQGSI